MPIIAEQLACNLEIDYSQVIGTRVFPFEIELDLENSNLIPGPGENQRFCYNVTGIGMDIPIFADLSHWVLGICDQITEAEIVNITVVIDGVEQEVEFGEGGNVELRTPENPDPQTGCAGLKFDFGLDKVDGVMNVCFELTTTYPIGPNAVCLFGGDTAATGLSICGPVCDEQQICTANAFQEATICVPVEVIPFANPGETTTFCCGDPVITPGTEVCPGEVNGRCRFNITQTICVRVPVEFGADAIVDDPRVQCGEVSSEDICTGCTPAQAPVKGSCSCGKGKKS